GEITILPTHRSYIGALKPGEVVLKSQDGKDELAMAVSGGFIEFTNGTNNLVVLADTAERADEIDLTRAEEARKKAENLKDQAISMDENEYARILASIDKNWARIKVARRHHTRRAMNINQ
ncbi:MAG: ATP synthase F1 subunit epsilon, partial [Patescibacteria group bacterium]